MITYLEQSKIDSDKRLSALQANGWTFPIIDGCIVPLAPRTFRPEYGDSHTLSTVKENNPTLISEVITPDYEGFMEHYSELEEAGCPISVSELKKLAKIYHTEVPVNYNGVLTFIKD